MTAHSGGAQDITGSWSTDDDGGGRQQLSTQVELKVTGHWMSYWFLRVFATPVALINGVAHDLRWAEFETLRVEPGGVELGVGVRYGKRDLVGGLAPLEPAQLDFAPGQVRRFVAQNGFVNHSPFLIYEVGCEDMQ